jgi:8-oxo-dGTP pyrophosphatase MutT (NUDIX family)
VLEAHDMPQWRESLGASSLLSGGFDGIRFARTTGLAFPIIWQDSRFHSPRGRLRLRNVWPGCATIQFQLFVFTRRLAGHTMTIATSCGTLVINTQGQILLCHVTGTTHWDIPKGLRDPGESSIDAARRELREETGLEFDRAQFQEIGPFDYRPDKRLHLYKVHTPEDFFDLAHLKCTSYFIHPVSRKELPEMDGFRWAERNDIRRLCWPRMAARLLALDW